MPERDRIDRLLVERGLAPTRTRAQALVVAGKVVVAGHRVDKPGTMVAKDAEVVVRGADHPYVSRGGVKLAGALDTFAELVVAEKIAIDIGASTGGFTDCLLQRGVARVHAVDVGYGQLAWALVQDPRVVVHDRCNIRTLAQSVIGEPVALAVIDCSFIALAKVLPHVPRFLSADADVVALVKPQFELDPSRIGKGGIVKDDADREEALARAGEVADACGLRRLGSCDSAISGSDGNRELFLWLRWTGSVPAREPDA
ncbi:MAG TPA: TlyA family RNA methyltransferase [Nannocystaceae bacterium]|nr:TlyA family RNA methyltransferase [Nannocystaceae bacterium]